MAKRSFVRRKEGWSKIHQWNFWKIAVKDENLTIFSGYGTSRTSPSLGEGIQRKNLERNNKLLLNQQG